jgi:hypothetical protein
MMSFSQLWNWAWFAVTGGAEKTSDKAGESASTLDRRVAQANRVAFCPPLKTKNRQEHFALAGSQLKARPQKAACEDIY